MYFLHAGWIPSSEKPEAGSRSNRGRLHLWLESAPESEDRCERGSSDHLVGAGVRELLVSLLPFAKGVEQHLGGEEEIFANLPASAAGVLPSFELMRYRGEEPPEEFVWKGCRLVSVATDTPLLLLKELHFLAANSRDRVTLASDLLFWYHFSRRLALWIRQHRYLPALVTHPAARGRAAAGHSPLWRPLSEDYEAVLKEYAQAMPPVSLALSTTQLRPKSKSQPRLREPLPLLRHFCEQVTTDLVVQTPFTRKAVSGVAGTLIESALAQADGAAAISDEMAQQWRLWYHHLNQSQRDSRLVLGFRLHDAPVNKPDSWWLQWLLSSHSPADPPLPLADYWQLDDAAREQLRGRFGESIEQELLLQIGQAARIYPELWQGLKSSAPTGVELSRSQAITFLRESAWLLEESGYRVIVPAWWSASGRRRARLRLRASSKSSKSSSVAAVSSGHFNLSDLANFDYQLAVGDEIVDEAEWRQLMASGETLVNFRGQWVELDREQMAQSLALLEAGAESGLSVTDLLKRESEAEEEGFELLYDDTLEEMMERLRHPSSIAISGSPTAFQGELRQYQQRGLAWIDYLERLGMGACLADDMGLGKTVQVIALLQREREEAAAEGERPGPTLLIAPTSVLGNWQHELQRFAPELRSQIHHGTSREKAPAAFASLVAGVDLLITSFALLRLDDKLFHSQQWQRVVVDEAQNLKNPRSAQTRAILKLQSRYRLALTGTPIENRLLDLWSIFHFLNPGYLGSSTRFRDRFEKPIQRDEDQDRARQLKQLVEPFILRRLKSDKSIIKDLPDKVEQKTYCNLSREQATLYQGVVDQVDQALEQADGMERRGLMLSTLTRLKQICNHPAQFLLDDSPFLPERSHKLERLNEMVEEVMAEGESLLIFTQFNETGRSLERHFRQHAHYPTSYLHGGTSRRQRERMIAEFQDPQQPPGIFILSLKAGGVGITLTAANHVFHFDRWWNPAVENQAGVCPQDGSAWHP